MFWSRLYKYKIAHLQTIAQTVVQQQSPHLSEIDVVNTLLGLVKTINRIRTVRAMFNLFTEVEQITSAYPQYTTKLNIWLQDFEHTFLVSLRTSLKNLDPTLKTENVFKRNFGMSLSVIQTFLNAITTFDKIREEFEGTTDATRATEKQLLCLNWFSEFISTYEYGPIVDETERKEEEEKLNLVLYHLSISSVSVGFGYLMKRSPTVAMNVFANISMSYVSGPIPQGVADALRMIARETSQSKSYIYYITISTWGICFSELFRLVLLSI